MPVFDEVILSLASMNKIISLDKVGLLSALAHAWRCTATDKLLKRVSMLKQHTVL